ncbi:hypothetical protein RhiirA5_431119 [Rhizophagus irregularis]|uniref:HAT C-terminal dimerisation domain-containing protein n=2 Tax=Rhizophagus irregularis TaxID=588596 RepID=A0A2N0NVJ4_9GLOM|nr:hypothetical protein RhiirA5_431119 [Rhizophagus irregularis]
MGNNSKSCEDLFLQMRQYKLKLVPYKEEFRNNDETPILWWLATDDTKNYLQQLALHILSVTLYIESMAKIRSFYISKVNEELKYASSKYSQKQHEIPNHIVSVLILENIFDINAVPFIKDPEDSDSDSDDDDESEDDDKNDNEIETENESEEELIMDYDVDELASKYLD